MPRGKAQDPPPSSRERKTAAQQPARWAGELACSTPFSLPKISPTTAALITGDPTPLTPPPPLPPFYHFVHPKAHSWYFLPQLFFFLLLQDAITVSPPSQHKHLPPPPSHSHPSQGVPLLPPGPGMVLWGPHMQPWLRADSLTKALCSPPPHCHVPQLPPSPRQG